MQDIVLNILYNDKMTKEEKRTAVSTYKTELSVKLEEAIQSLEKAIKEGEGTGKTIIGGYMFDGRFSKSLLELLKTDIESGNKELYEKTEDFINLQLISASKQFRELAKMLHDACVLNEFMEEECIED